MVKCARTRKHYYQNNAFPGKFCLNSTTVSEWLKFNVYDDDTENVVFHYCIKSCWN